MKKVISLFLTIAIAFSMFSCVGIVAGAATRYLVLDQKNIVPHATWAVFVPQETGAYKFASDGYGDPRIEIYCESGYYYLDDQVGLDFSGTIELQAGEEVSCYLYNYEGSDCVFTISKVETPESISFTLANPIELVENIGGYWESFYNSEKDEWDQAYFYENYSIRKAGNVLSVKYSDGETETYTYDGYEWYDENGKEIESGALRCYDYQSVTPWTVGGENYITVSYMGVETQVPVSVIENPVSAIEFIPAKPYELIENMGGYAENFYNRETGEWENVYFYNDYSVEVDGNILKVHFNDGRVIDYTYSYWDDEWLDADENQLPYDYVRCYDYQSVDNWTVGGDNSFVVKYMNYETNVPVSVIANPVESIEFIPAEPYEIMENTDGYWEMWYNQEECEWENTYFYDSYSIKEKDNVLRVNMTDGSVVDYTYRGVEKEENHWYYEWYDESDNKLPYDDIRCYDYQSVDPWTVNGENYFVVKYLGKEAQVPVNIYENPYLSLEFIPAESLVIKENTGGWWETRYDGTEEVPVYNYNVDNLVERKNNVIKIIKKDGTIIKYTRNGNRYYNEYGECLSFSAYKIDDDQWGVGKENKFVIDAGYVKGTFNVNIIEDSKYVAEDVFVAEKISDTECIITDILLNEYGFDGVIDIPEEVDGYTIIGIEDGLLGKFQYLRGVYLPSGFSMISEHLFDECYNLEEINVSEDNEVFESVNGVLYNEALTEIYYCPYAFTGTLVIKAGVTELSDNVTSGLTNGATIEIEEGNTAFALEDGILYNADFTKIYKAISPDADYEMKSTVTEISDYAFCGNESLESVKVAEGVTEISYMSFASCEALKNVELPSTLVSIEGSAFMRDSALEGITLPETTKSIGISAFRGCSSMAEFNINEGLETLGDWAFHKSGVEKIELPDSLTTLGEGCFYYSEKLTELTIGTGLTEIPYCAFTNTSIENLEIPENITSIGERSFYGIDITSLYLHDKITYIDGAFGNCDKLTYVYVGSGIQSMEGAFGWCDNLKKVEFAEGHDAERKGAFSGCSQLEEIIIPSTVTKIAYREYQYCTSLVNIDIPYDLYDVEARSFDDTGWYNNQPEGQVYLEHVFYDYKGDMPENYTLVIKDGTKSIADEAVSYEKNLVAVELPEGLKHIGFVAFEGCKNLTDITIPSSVETIDDYAIGYTYYCYGYVKYGDVIIRGMPGSEAERYANACGFTFIEVEHEHNPTDWIIDSEATCTEDGAKHKECTVCGKTIDVDVIPATGHKFKLSDIMEIHPHTVTYECTNCEETKTEVYADSDCIECNFKFTAIDSNSYKLSAYTGTNADVVIPATYKNRVVTTIAAGCFKGNSAIKSVKLSEGVTEIGSLAFMNCSALEKVIIPESVTKIGTQAFYGFKGVIYCQNGSFAHQYAVDKNIDYVLLSITETAHSQIDYNKMLIYTKVQNCEDITSILAVSETAIAIPVASSMHGDREIYGTGTIISVFDGDEYIGDFTLIVEGDVDGDSTCDVIDAMLAERTASGHAELYDAYAIAADGNGDEVIDVVDYQNLVNKALA